jgi:hypothetical protein
MLLFFFFEKKIFFLKKKIKRECFMKSSQLSGKAVSSDSKQNMKVVVRVRPQMAAEENNMAVEVDGKAVLLSYRERTSFL